MSDGGILFPNDKGGVAIRPDYRGDITIGDVKYRLSAWIREGRKGQYLSLQATKEDTFLVKASEAVQNTQSPKEASEETPFN